MPELTDLDRSLLAVIKQCTLVSDVKDDKKEAVRRANILIDLSNSVLERVLGND